MPSAQDAEAVVLGDVAQPDEPASVAFNVGSKSLPIRTNSDESTEDLSMLMDLIANAFEQGLILEVRSHCIYAHYCCILL
jgi:hypothetical protein